MLTTLDKYLLRNFLFAYLATFSCLVLMYIVIDVFAKFEEFTAPDPARQAIKETRANAADTTGHKHRQGKPVREETASQRAWLFCRNVVVFYGYRIPVFFQRVNGIMLLLAGAFTLGLLERRNELMPILSSGVSMRRLLIPLGAVTSFFLVLQLLDTELVIPHCADNLLRQAEDPLGKRPLLVPGTFDDRHIHIEARVAYPLRQMIQYARVTLPPDLAGNTIHINSMEMFYHPGTGAHDHGWIMNGCKPEKLQIKHPAIREIQPGQFFLHTELSYTRLTRRPNWYLYHSTAQLMDVIENEQGVAQRSAIIGQVHQRMLAPIYDLLLILLGLPIIAGRSEWNIFIRVGWCLLIFAMMQGLGMASTMMAKNDAVDPALAAWLPLLMFGPFVPPVLTSMRT
ncbi:MAG: LptF/LptG family permease [Gemmatales bacterium]